MPNRVLIKIDRSIPLDLFELFGEKGWSMVEQDDRSLALNEIDLEKIDFRRTLNNDEAYITGEEAVSRLKKTDCVRLDAKVFQEFYKNKHLIPYDLRGFGIHFDGTIFIAPNGHRCSLALFWNGNTWIWRYQQLFCLRFYTSLSACVKN